MFKLNCEGRLPNKLTIMIIQNIYVYPNNKIMNISILSSIIISNIFAVFPIFTAKMYFKL